jgi:hypothetical protein
MRPEEIKLFLSSFVMLFAETMAIRWLGIEVPVFRAFPNLILMVAFIGAASGIAKPEVKLKPILVALCALAPLLCVLLIPHTQLIQMTLRLDNQESQNLSPLLSIFTIGINAIALMYLFRAIGTTVGEGFQKLPPLRAYGINILGSLLGVAGFALLSFLHAAPWLWLVATIIGCSAFTRPKLLLGLGLPLTVASAIATQGAFWSPYGKLQIKTFELPANSLYGPGNYMLFCNNAYFHLATHAPDKSQLPAIQAEAKTSHQTHILYRDYNWMDLPYRFAAKKDKVLILGSGSGNDVAFALKNDVPSIHAVEIDPVIGNFGKTIHPDKPYLNKKVKLIIDDARSVLRKTAVDDTTYDIIDFSCLDPGGTLNTASFLRVDNYVYTEECIKDTLKHIKPNGIIAMSFATGPNNPITSRLYNTIEKACGQPPVAMVDKLFDSCIFLFGPGVGNNRQAAEKLATDFIAQDKEAEFSRFTPSAEQQKITPCSDDWPFLYLQFDSSGLITYGLVLLVTIMTPVLLMLKGNKDLIQSGSSFAMFFLGEAFMLMETKSCTQLSLIWGNTWIVSSVVIFTILLLGFFGNLLIDKCKPLPRIAIYASITAFLLLDYFWPTFNLNLEPTLYKGLTTLVACLPVFFGSLLFSSLFKESKEPNTLLAANLLGVTFGGLLENFCVLSGVRSLSLLALFLYLASCAPSLFTRRKP